MMSDAAMATWNAVMARKDAGKPRARDCANNLTRDELTTILAVADFFGADDRDLQQIAFDLYAARYRVFDWLAMCVMGRIDCRTAVQVYAYSFLKVGGDVDAFIADLRETDYDVDLAWSGTVVD